MRCSSAVDVVGKFALERMCGDWRVEDDDEDDGCPCDACDTIEDIVTGVCVRVRVCS